LIALTLPYPPSANAYWRHPTKGKLAGRHLISEKGRAYRQAVLAAVLEQRPGKAAGRISVEVLAFAPDRRKRDTDNLLKALFDGITHAGVWADDSQIRRHTVEFDDEVLPGGQVIVFISEFKPELAERISLARNVSIRQTSTEGAQQ